MTCVKDRATVAVLASLACGPTPLLAQDSSPQAVGAPRDWVTVQQQEDGRWTGPARDDGSAADVRATSFALLAYLGDGSSTEAGPHRDVVRRGVRWLVEAQGERGELGAATSLNDRAIATWALANVVVLGADELAPAAQRAIDDLERRGNPGHPEFDLQLAAWRCLVRNAVQTPREGDEPLLTIDEERFGVLRLWLAGRASRPIESATELDLAAELAARVALDRFAASTDPRTAALRAAILGHERRFDEPASAPDPRATFLATWAFYVLGGPDWQAWSRQLTGLRDAQRTDGELRGTFDPGTSTWCRDGGRVTSSALGAMTLEIYFRYSRLVR